LILFDFGVWLFKKLNSKATEKNLEEFKKDLVLSLVWGLVLGLVWVLVGGLVLGLVWGLVLGLVLGLVGGLVWGLVLGLVLFLVLFLVWGLVWGLVLGLVGGLVNPSFPVELWVGALIVLALAELIFWFQKDSKPSKEHFWLTILWRKAIAVFESLLILVNLNWLRFIDWVVAKEYLGYFGFVAIGLFLIWFWLKANALKYRGKKK